MDIIPHKKPVENKFKLEKNVTLLMVWAIFLFFGIGIYLMYQKPDLIKILNLAVPTVSPAKPKPSLPPSGAPAETRTPVVTGKAQECIVSGCNNEICADREMFSTCILKPEYECYRGAICEKQADGKCGFRQTESLKTCLSKF